MSKPLKILQVISNLLGEALRSFAFTLLLVDLLYGIFMASLAFWIAADGSALRGALAVIVILGLVTSFGFFLALQTATLKTVRRAIQESEIGTLIFDSIFEKIGQLKGDILNEKLAIHDVQRILNQASKKLLGAEADSSSISSLAFWFSSQIQRISVWATTKMIIRSCSKDGSTVRLNDVRIKLAGTIDALLVDYLKEQVQRLTFYGLGIVTSLSFLLCIAIRSLSI